jgi:hypothetical protein
MSLLSRIVFIFIAAAVSTQPATNTAPAPRMSADKIPYPEVTNADFKTFEQLPLVGKLMGQTPEKALDGRWVSISGESERASRLRSKLADLKIGTNGTQFATSGGTAGATDTLIGLTDGRVTRVVLVFGDKLTWDDAQRKMKDFSVQAVSAERGVNMHAFWGEIDRGNMKYYARVIGYWQQTIPASTRETVLGNGKETKTVVPEQHVDGPTGIVVDIDAVSWGLANFVAPEHVADVQQHKLATGMTEAEARVAMFGRQSRTIDENGVTKIEFYQPRMRGMRGGGGGGAANAGAGDAGGGAPVQGRRRRGAAAGGGGGAIAPANNNPQPPAGNNQAAAGGGAPGAYSGNFTIPGRGLAQEVDFSEDTGNVDPRSTLVASAVFKDGKLTEMTGS